MGELKGTLTDTLSNDKYKRPDPMGGFAAAPNDTYQVKPPPQVLQVPTDPAAQAAGAATNPTTPTEPTLSATEKFYAQFGMKVPRPGGTATTDPTMPVVPHMSEVTADQIANTFKPLFQAIETQAHPEPRALPPPTPALATFLSVLAGSLGAHLTKNPAVQESIMNTLHETDARRKAIEDQNYANDLLFNQQKATERLNATGQQLTAQLDAAIKKGDVENAMKLQGYLEKLKSYYDIAGIRVQGEEVRKSQMNEAALKVGMEEAAGKEGKEAETLEPKDYAKNRNDLLTSKEQPENKGGFLGFGQQHPRMIAVANFDKTALHSGNPATVAAAKRNIQQTVLKELKLQMKTKFTPADSKRIREKLREMYDLGPEEVDF